MPARLACPPHSPARSCPWPPRSAYQLEAYDEMEARQAGWLAMAGGAWLEGGPELATRLPCIKYALFILLIMLAGTRRQN